MTRTDTLFPYTTLFRSRNGFDRNPGPRRRHARRLAGPRILAALPAVQAAALAGGADHDGCGNTRCEGRPFRLDTRAGSRRGVSRVGRGYAPGAWLACPGDRKSTRLNSSH